ncbi:MAG: hypothetical protein ABL963_07415 [Longimicrobiales bacterium]
MRNDYRPSAVILSSHLARAACLAVADNSLALTFSGRVRAPRLVPRAAAGGAAVGSVPSGGATGADPTLGADPPDFFFFFELDFLAIPKNNGGTAVP